MLRLSRVIAEGARARDESRGAHFKPAFENRNDADWLRTTLASAKEDGTPKFIRDFTYECAGKSVSINDKVDVSLEKPRARKYEVAGAASRGGAA